MTPTEIIDNIAPTALFDIAGDDTPEQQEWAAILLDAVDLLMAKYEYTGKMTLTRDQIRMNADGCRKHAQTLREREAERLKSVEPVPPPPNPFL